jgi:hypothetical protein
VLAKLASNLCLHDQAQIPIYQTWVIPPMFEQKNDEEHEIHSIFANDIDKKD